jgi:hypothetical protein
VGHAIRGEEVVGATKDIGISRDEALAGVQG